jgi:hypothetical protein
MAIGFKSSFFIGERVTIIDLKNFKKREVDCRESVVWFFKGIGNNFLDGLDIG